jgi:hypothetical protein
MPVLFGWVFLEIFRLSKPGLVRHNMIRVTAQTLSCCHCCVCHVVAGYSSHDRSGLLLYIRCNQTWPYAYREAVSRCIGRLYTERSMHVS